MNLDHWTGLRDKWKKARASAGAVKGVDMGEAIHAVEKSRKIGLSAVEKSLKKVLEAVKKYFAGAKDDDKKSVEWLKANVQAPAVKAAYAVVADLQEIRKFAAVLANFKPPSMADAAEYKIKFDYWLKQKPETTWDDVSTQYFLKMRQSFKAWQDFAIKTKAFAGAIEMVLPGKPGKTQYQESAAELLQHSAFGDKILATQGTDYLKLSTVLRTHPDLETRLITEVGRLTGWVKDAVGPG